MMKLINNIINRIDTMDQFQSFTSWLGTIPDLGCYGSTERFRIWVMRKLNRIDYEVVMEIISSLSIFDGKLFVIDENMSWTDIEFIIGEISITLARICQDDNEFEEGCALAMECIEPSMRSYLNIPRI